MVIINKAGLATEEDRLQNTPSGLSLALHGERCKQTRVQAILTWVLEALQGISGNMQIVSLVLDTSELPEH